VEDLHQKASQRLAYMIVDFQLNAYRAKIIKSCIIPCWELMIDYVKSNGKFSIVRVLSSPPIPTIKLNRIEGNLDFITHCFLITFQMVGISPYLCNISRNEQFR